jgi:NitT/TauT family transport system substrate-binding protein
MSIVLSENFRAVFYAPFYAAGAIGAFTDAGVKVDYKPSASPEEAAKALRSGAADVMWGGPLRVMTVHDREPGADLVCFCDVVVRDPFFVVGARPKPDFRLADLAAVKFATVSEVPTPWICLSDDLRRAGIDPVRIARVADGTMAENEAALRAGKVDAIQVFQPYAEWLVATGAGHVWYAAANRGRTAYTTLITRRGTLARRADELLAMTSAMHRTLQWFGCTPPVEIAHTLSGHFPDLEPAILASAIERYRSLGLWGSDPIIRREGYDRLHAAMRAFGALSRDIPFESCVDVSLAERAMA